MVDDRGLGTGRCKQSLMITSWSRLASAEDMGRAACGHEGLPRKCQNGSPESAPAGLAALLGVVPMSTESLAPSSVSDSGPGPAWQRERSETMLASDAYLASSH